MRRPEGEAPGKRGAVNRPAAVDHSLIRWRPSARQPGFGEAVCSRRVTHLPADHLNLVEGVHRAKPAQGRLGIKAGPAYAAALYVDKIFPV
jgi:hypothetical protein